MAAFVVTLIVVVGVNTLLWVSASVAVCVSVLPLSWKDVRAPKDMGPIGAGARAPSAESALES